MVRPAALMALALAALLAACAQPREAPTDTTARVEPAPQPRVETTPPPRPATPPKADRVVVLKSQRRLLLLDDGEILHAFEVALGGSPVGPKRREGDERTPEGSYTLDWRNPDSRFYRSIHVSYPGPEDRARAERMGVDPGDNIMIHGLPKKFAFMGERHVVADWTDGCIAVTNDQMDVIWNTVEDGTPIEIRP